MANNGINKIRVRRGLSADLKQLDEAEPGFATDTGKLYIGSSDGNVCVNPDSIYPRLDITATSGTEVTVTDGNTTLTQTSTGIASIYVPNFGTWTVTAGNYSKSFEIDTVKVYKIIAQALQDTSWDEINRLSMAGKASERWSIGDEKDIEVDGETLTLVILDFDHDDLADGTGKAGITFGLKNLMAETRAMNSSQTNAGGFVGSEMYTWLQDNLLNSLPSEIQSILKTVNKKTSVGYAAGDTIIANSMKLFLFSEWEVQGDTAYSVAGEGEHYPYFGTMGQRTKYTSNGKGKSAVWWLRSPQKGNKNCFCATNGIGLYYRGTSDKSYGVCFGFCV